MEFLRRKCVYCKALSPLNCYNGDLKTCVSCLEKAKVKYIENREIMIRRSKTYRDNNIEKEKERHRLYHFNNRELVKERRQEYKYLEYYCPVCLYTVKLYRKNKHCKSMLHLNNLKYCDEQKQICILNSHLENNIDHNAIDEEVKQLIDEDIKNNLIQQSLLDAIRHFNTRIENAMNRRY